ncbi:MAG: LamG domain-containing protein, partial [Phycisphaerae bacterium]|nr:LamG domain-containing protein [Phycisphaerae bacterium]
MKMSIGIRIVGILAVMMVSGPAGFGADLCPVGDIDGNCRVDIGDLVELSYDWLWRPDYPALKLGGFWKLDESSGQTALDSSPGNHPGMLKNGPVWQPTAGRINGCLQFDGVNDYVNLGAVLNPADGPFTVCLWFKGGEAKKTLLGQADGSGFGRDWLQIDTNGYLRTMLIDALPVPLTGNILVTGDQDWHHAALVWNGSKRKLYVDGVLDVEDASPLLGNLLGCTGSLYLGATRGLASVNFWSGSLDEVRIYTRALSVSEISGLVYPCQPNPKPADFNCSEGVDFSDLAVLASNWLRGPRAEYRCIWADSW